MYISDLQRNKKSRKSVLFKRKVVEIYRAEIADQHQIHKELNIPQAKLRQMNRWYFKHRVKPYLYSHLTFNRITKKKTDASYLKALEKRLLDSLKWYLHNKSVLEICNIQLDTRKPANFQMVSVAYKILIRICQKVSGQLRSGRKP